MVLANARSLMTTDYSKCCSKSETATIEKRGKGSADPNYDPYNKENSSRKFSSSSKNTLYVDAPKETLTMSGAEMSIGDNQNGMANANVKKTVTFSVSTITPTFSTPSNSPSKYIHTSFIKDMLLLKRFQYLKTLPKLSI